MAGTRRAATGLAIALLVCACDRRPDDVAVVASVIGGPAQTGDPNRATLTPASRVLLGATAQGLVAFDAAGGIEPALAERWIVTDDGRSFIFRLREDARWADGTPVRSADVAASLSRTIAPARRNPLLPYLSAIDRIVAMTPRVIEVRLTAPRPDLLKLFAQPELAVTRRGRGSGPFEVIDGAPRGAVRLRPIRDAQDSEEAAIIRPEDYVVLRGERAALAIARYIAKQSDLVEGGTLDAFPLIAVAGVAPANIRMDAPAGMFGLSVRPGNPFLSDAANRAAIAAAIDRERITTAFSSAWAPTERLLPERLDSAADPARGRWAIGSRRDRLQQARLQVAQWGSPVTLDIALPKGPGGNLLWTALAGSLREAGINTRRVGIAEPADLVLIDRVAPYDSARWYLRNACQPCAAATAARIAAARDANDLPTRAARIAEADAALAEEVTFIPIARPLRWSLVAQRLRGWTANARAWHPLNRLRRDPN